MVYYNLICMVWCKNALSLNEVWTLNRDESRYSETNFFEFSGIKIFFWILGVHFTRVYKTVRGINANPMNGLVSTLQRTYLITIRQALVQQSIEGGKLCLDEL